MSENEKPPEPQMPEEVATEAAPTIDPAKFQAFIDHLESQQNFPMATVAGVVAALLGAAAWALVTVSTKHQIGWMAVGVGILVGFAVRIVGKGISSKFRILGAGCAFLGCLLGNLFTTCGFLADQAPFFQVLFNVLTNPFIALELMKVTFQPMDVLFYGIAIYEGYQFSFRPITDEELAALT